MTDFTATSSPRFLLRFLNGVFRRRHRDLAPSAGERPCAVRLVYKQNFSVSEYRGAGIDLRRLISAVGAEHPRYRVERKLGLHRDDLRRDLADAFVPLAVVNVLPVVKSRLREALKLDRVFRQPVSFHKSSLFTARNAAVRRTAFADADFYFIIFFCRRSAASFVSAAHGMRKRAYRRAGYLNPSGGSQRRRRVRDIIFRAARAAVRRLRRYRSAFRMR